MSVAAIYGGAPIWAWSIALAPWIAVLLVALYELWRAFRP